MINMGEQLVASYLRYIRRCDFIQTNLYTIEAHGEIDVVGICLHEKKVYVCEVAIHLTTGLQYVKDKRTNNVQKLTDKFTKDIAYANKYLSEYERHFMLWSPIVKNSQGAAVHNQLGHIAEVKANILAKHHVELECVINEQFQDCLAEMRTYAALQTAELQCPIMRLFQMEALLAKHVTKLKAAEIVA